MTKEELKEHCQRQVQQFERVEKIMPVTPNDWKRYEEHKFVLELLEQELKTGHWVRWYETIEKERCTIHDPHCKCSECNYEYDPYIASLFNYCPNCGAKMESEE